MHFLLNIGSDACARGAPQKVVIPTSKAKYSDNLNGLLLACGTGLTKSFCTAPLWPLLGQIEFGQLDLTLRSKVA
jgi:hypothetical protein